MSDEFIRDDTDLSLLERTNFQVVSPSNGKAVDSFVDDVEELSRDEVGLARSPWVRIALGVGAASFVLGLGFTLSRGNRNDKQAVVKSTDNTEESDLTLELEEPADAPAASGRSEVDAMRSEIALLEQQLALSSIERDPTAVNAARRVGAENSEAQVQPAQVPPKPVTKPVSAVQATPRPVPTPVAARPLAPQSSYQPAPRTITRVVPAPAAPAAPAPSFSGSSNRLDPVDPQQAWLAASTAGIFGSMPPMMALAPPSEMVLREDNPTYELQSASFVEVEDSGLFASNGPIPGLIYSGPSLIPMGRAVKAKVVSPISWLSDRDQFTIQLIDDVLDQSDEVAIPSGSFVVVQPVSVDESSGLAELAAVGIELNGEMIPIDYQNIAIRGKGGDPLIAERYGNVGGDIASNDLEMFAVGALGGIGEILTRPDSQTVTTGALSSSSSTNYGDRNILGAILAGGTRDLTSRMADRNDERLDEIRARGVIYYLPEGKEVQFYVNSEFQL